MHQVEENARRKKVKGTKYCYVQTVDEALILPYPYCKIITRSEEIRLNCLICEISASGSFKPKIFQQIKYICWQVRSYFDNFSVLTTSSSKQNIG